MNTLILVGLNSLSITSFSFAFAFTESLWLAQKLKKPWIKAKQP